MQQNVDLNKLVVVVGPTAVGKTDIGIKVAKQINGEIISADSMLVYKNMNIGTAKPSYEEMEGVPHHLIDIVDPFYSFSTSDFKERAEAAIAEIYAKDKLPFVVGGTGLYVNSIINNYDFTPAAKDLEYREQLRELADKNGIPFLHNKLKEIDPASFDRIHPNDFKRISRALEVYHFSGKTITYYQEESKKVPQKYDLRIIGLTIDRALLYNRIDKRVDLMIEKGLVDEVKMLKGMGCNETHTSMQGLGYKEILKYLDGEYTLDYAIYKIKLETRHFAKRQISWFKRDERIKWFNINEYTCLENLIKDIIYYIENKETYVR